MLGRVLEGHRGERVSRWSIRTERTLRNATGGVGRAVALIPVTTARAPSGVVVKRLPRVLLALAASGAMCALGYVALIASIHNSSAVLVAVQWVTLPIFSGVAAGDHGRSEIVYWLAVIGSGGLWFIVLLTLLPRRLHLNNGGS